MSKRKDDRGRVLRNGEMQEANGRYRFKYIDAFGEAQYVRSWRLDVNDPCPPKRKLGPALRELEKKIRKNKFDFDDFMSQIQQIKKMGNIKDLAAMIPGVGKAIKDIDIDDNAFKGIEAIIQSMTPKERQNPDIINQSRRLRIARGSGTKIEDVNRLMKQFDQTRKMMRMVAGGPNAQMMKMAQAMRGKMRMN